MGYNTSMIILNDGLEDIKNDPEFGKKVASAVNKLSLREHPEWGIDISAGCHGNVATVIESHHADSTSVIAFGGNSGTVLSAGLWAYGTEDEKIRILKTLADQYGYNLHRKRTPVFDR